MSDPRWDIDLPPRTPAVGCPPWCSPTLCSNFAVREGSLWHHAEPHVVKAFQDGECQPLKVQANWVEKPEIHRGNDYPAFEQPMVTVWEAELDLTPAQARALAAALLAAADTLEPAEPIPTPA